MNLKAIVPLALAAVLGVVAIFLVRNAIAHRNGAPTPTGNTVAVVVAKRDANPGTPLTREDLTVAHLPADAAPGQVFSTPDQLVNRVVGQTPLVRGQAILETMLAPTGSGHGLQALVPPGMRAVTIEVNEYTGVGGMLEPGCRVDLVAVMRDDKSKESVARTVLQNIKISAIGRSTAPVEAAPGQPLPPPANSVTILVTPQQVQSLELASMSGRPWLVLRSTRDGAEVPIEGTTLSEVLGHSAQDQNATDSTDPNAGTTAAAGTPVPTPTPTVTPTVTPVVSTTTDTATQPQQPQQPQYTRRTVSIIREGVESTYTFMIPVTPAAQKPMSVDDGQETPVIPGSK
jgi:pilus assembly protein CpaB